MIFVELIGNSVVDLTRSHVGKEAAVSDKTQIIKILENVGKTLQPLELAYIILITYQRNWVSSRKK